MREAWDEYIVLAMTGRASGDDLDQLDRWRKMSHENERHYQEFVALWRLTGAHPSAQLHGEIPTATDLLESTRGPYRFRAHPPRADRVRRTSWGSRWRAAAVAAAVVVTLGLVYLTAARSASRVALAEFRTGPNELSTVVLDDGTMVRMAPSSRLTVALEPDKREARLDGRAFFAVTPDPERPFDVRTHGGVVVRVLGTRFDLHSKRGRAGARLLVLDGKVALSTPAGRSDLVAGDLAVTSPSAPQSIRRVDEPERLLEWMGAWVAFEGTPLHRVVRELEVRLGVPIAIADPSVGERTVIGWFAHEKPEEVIEMVCRVADVDCRWVDGGVVISERAG
jgi:transmembrane sensor